MFRSILPPRQNKSALGNARSKSFAGHSLRPAKRLRDWTILIEVPLLRLGKRLDVVLLAPGLVAIIEFKIGATRYDSADKAQTEGYAHSLRDFHEASQRRMVVPILCAEKAPDRPIGIAVADGVADLVLDERKDTWRAFSGSRAACRSQRR